uniref:Anoctamin n=1 Tax=Elaeophora elaphi TaxID=1147741 RepID=A0A0R3RTD7_9BILA
MFVPRGLEAGGDAAAQVEERRRAQLETRNDALRFLLIPVVLELGRINIGGIQMPGYELPFFQLRLYLAYIQAVVFIQLVLSPIGMSILAKIAEIEAEMARTQKNKATMGHLGMLKARIAKLRRELITPKGGGGGSGEGFDVAKTGDARIGFVG